MEAQIPLQSGARPGAVQRVEFEPVSRVAGALAVHALADSGTGAVLESAAMATLFRGYEVILLGRDVRDAIFISSRACGVCGGAHATCSALACEMALGVAPPATAIAARNLMSGLEYLCDLPIQLFVRAGPDYSEPTVREMNPGLWQRAERTSAPGRATHGYKLISDIMTALTLVEGELYLEALTMSRTAREAYVLIGGKYPHPQTILPGGVSSTIDTQDYNTMLLRIVRFLDYAKRAVTIWDDIIEFFYGAEPRYRELGRGPRNFIGLGQWDDPLAYDGTFENCAGWGERRWATPGAIVDGRLVTTALPEINARVEEFVDHSFYEQWSVDALSALGAGDQRLATNHPATKRTIPQPGERNPQGRYSWSTAPRWDGHPMETGAYAHLWTTAMANKLPYRRFIDPTGHSLRLSLPQGKLPATELEWHPPELWGTFERTRARAYAFAYSALVTYEQVLTGLDLKRNRPDGMSTPYKIPKDVRVGTGFWGSPRGYLSHHMTIDGGVIGNYQILAPSTWTVSPKDFVGKPGPLEQAVTATPVLEYAPTDGYTEILRTIRSFDPCMACAAH
ncbi:MAG: nickel-dependent hydrogenase large subunit [Solirubrobacteraceae bacterium]